MSGIKGSMICKEMGLSSKEKILREIWELRLSTFG
jgi:hypothetical protein